MRNAMPGRPNLVLASGVAILAALGVCPVRAQDAAPEAQAGFTGLKAELHAVRPLYSPDGPLRLRFVLANTSDQPVDIPLETALAPGDGVGLPVSLILGGEQRWLSVVFETEAPKEVQLPPTPTTRTADAPGSLRLAAHATLGAELDLREYYQPARYPGSYHIEWKPLDGRIGVVTADWRVEIRKDAILITDRPGNITFALDYDGAPQNVENFLGLVRDGFYNGKTFHRVIPGYLIQGGCPKGDGTGTRPDGKTVPAEFRDVPIDAGTLVMAHKPTDPNSASCQFFIALARLPDLDGKYTVIGRVRDEDSLRVLQQLAETPTDQRDRPLSPLAIRSINLVDVPTTQSREVQLHYSRAADRAAERSATPGSQPAR